MSRSGILLVDKPEGPTSHGVVSRVRRAANTRRVGHAGTLDPAATGLLVLGIGTATRLLTYLVGLDKQYTATIRLGWATTTDDAEGEPLASPADTSGITAEDISAAIAPLTGRISQVPSSVSAIKVDGKRSYDRARAGEEVVLAAREVTVSRFDVLAERRGDTLDLDVVVDVSSGTYVRALARDLGAALGVGGHLTALRRTRVGPLGIDEAVALTDDLDVAAALLPPAALARRLFPAIDLDDQAARDLGNGKRIRAEVEDAEIVAAVGPGERLIGLAGARDGRLTTLVNFPPEEDA